MVAVLLWQVLAVVLLPLVGIAAGILFLIAKAVFLVVMVCLAVWLFRRLARPEETPA